MIKRNESKQHLKNEVKEMIERNNINRKKEVYRPVE